MTTPRGQTPAWAPVFLEALAETGKVTQSAERAGIAPSTANSRRRKYPAFDEACNHALSQHRFLPTSEVEEPSPRRLPTWSGAFMAALAETSNVSESAQRANTDPANAYRQRRANPEFALAWRRALFEGYEHLEMEVLAFLRGQLTERKIDVANAIRQLAAHRKTVAEMRALDEDDDERAILASIDRMIDEMKAEWTEAQNGAQTGGDADG